MSNKKAKHINDLCLKSNLAPGAFHRRICDAIASDETCELAPPEISTTNRWYNGETYPKDQWHPYIAQVLEVSVEEIATGERPKADKMQDELEDLLKRINQSEEEKRRLASLLFMEKYYLRFFASFLIGVGIIFLNSTFWQNGLLYTLAIVFVIVINIYDNKREKKLHGNKTERTADRIKDNIYFVKSLMEKTLISRLALNMLIVIIAIIFLPTIELLFYRGKFYITCTVYFITAAILLIKSLE